MSYRIRLVIIALVWLLNGFYAKILGMVPRHEAIVGRVLGDFLNELQVVWLTKGIGLAEVVMMLWVLSRWRSRLCVLVQMALVIKMNVLEAWLAQDLLLWGKWNALFAAGFVLFLWYHEFVAGRRRKTA